MKTKGVYVLDSNAILQNAYYLLCVTYANKEFARRIDPQSEAYPLSALETRFFESELSRLLLQLAISIRVLDDQMKALPSTDDRRQAYYTKKAEIDKFDFAMFDDLNLNLRKTCNKIIHSTIMEPHFQDGVEGHEHDYSYRYGEGDKSITWKHFNGFVRLSGVDGGQDWYVLLDIEMFAKAIQQLYS
jgi:hypothetical protein